jgi:hypothetical protein
MADITYVQTSGQSDEDQAKTLHILKQFQEARLDRYNFETQWQEASLLCWPEYANTFFYGYQQYPGTKKTAQQIDSAASIASHRFGAIMDSLLTPTGMVWSRLKHPSAYVMKQKGVKAYYDALTERLWQYRYAATSNFVGANQQNMQGLGVFGNMNMLVESLDRKLFPGEKGLRYTHLPVGQVYYVANAQGAVDGYFRAFRWTARQIADCWPDRMPEALKVPLEAGSTTRYWVVQYVVPRTSDWQPWDFGPKNKRYASYYVCEVGKILLEESGYRTFPMPHGRYMVAPDEIYGRGPAQMVLPTLKTKNSQKSTFLEQGLRAGRPTWLLPEAGLINPQFHPGGYIQGGMGEGGKARVGVLPVGRIDMTKEMMDEEQLIIDDAFLVSLFKWALTLKDVPEMSPRQVVEMLERHAMFLAPTAGRQMTEYLANMVPRELDVLAAEGCLRDLPVPPAVREAGMEFHTTFDNPMTRMQAASEVAGFMQAVEMTDAVVKSSGDAALWDTYDFETALPEIAEKRGFPTRWLASAAKKAQRAQSRQQQQEKEFDVKSLPGRAAMAKAQAIAEKARTGGNTGGALSGTPPGGMPMMPQNAPSTPGA